MPIERQIKKVILIVLALMLLGFLLGKYVTILWWGIVVAAVVFLAIKFFRQKERGE